MAEKERGQGVAGKNETRPTTDAVISKLVELSRGVPASSGVKGDSKPARAARTADRR